MPSEIELYGSRATNAPDVFRVETVTDPARFAALREPWNTLVAFSAANGVFLSWDWLYAWWETFRQPRLAMGLVWGSGAELIGIAPLYRDCEWRKGIETPLLRLLGDTEVASDDLDLIVDPLRAEQVLFALRRWLQAQEWDQLLFSHIDARGSMVDRLLEPEQNGEGTMGRALRFEAYRLSCPRILLPESVETWRRSMTANRRSAIGRKYRRLQELGAKVRVLRGQEAATTGLDLLFALHRSRWDAMGRAAEDNLHRPEVELFHRRAAQGLAERDALRCYVLEHASGALAALYGFVDHGRFYFFQIGHRPDAGKLSPGAVIMAASIQGAIEEGCESYELLRGDEEYKAHWQNDVRFVRTVRAAALGRTRGAALLLAERSRRAILGALRRWRGQGAA